jgi:hypothetical protein
MKERVGKDDKRRVICDRVVIESGNYRFEQFKELIE